jgi:hypothetical protein
MGLARAAREASFTQLAPGAVNREIGARPFRRRPSSQGQASFTQLLPGAVNREIGASTEVQVGVRRQKR